MESGSLFWYVLVLQWVACSMMCASSGRRIILSSWLCKLALVSTVHFGTLFGLVSQTVHSTGADFNSEKKFETKHQLLGRLQEGVSFGDGTGSFIRYCVLDLVFVPIFSSAANRVRLLALPCAPFGISHERIQRS
jgi:hypothetical protein